MDVCKFHFNFGVPGYSELNDHNYWGHMISFLKHKEQNMGTQHAIPSRNFGVVTTENTIEIIDKTGDSLFINVFQEEFRTRTINHLRDLASDAFFEKEDDKAQALRECIDHLLDVDLNIDPPNNVTFTKKFFKEMAEKIPTQLYCEYPIMDVPDSEPS